MAEENQDTPLFTHDPTVREGDVALIFRENGDVQIAHNITNVRITNVIEANKSAGFVMALACLCVMENEPAFAAATREAAMRLDRGEFNSSSGLQ